MKRSMGKSIFLKKVTVSVLAMAVLVSSVTGCGKKESSADVKSVNQIKEIDKDHFFKEEEIKGVIEEGSEDVYLDYVGGKIKCVYLDQAGKYKFVSANTDGTVDKSYEIPVSTNDKHAFLKWMNPKICTCNILIMRVMKAIRKQAIILLNLTIPEKKREGKIYCQMLLRIVCFQ